LPEIASLPHNRNPYATASRL